MGTEGLNVEATKAWGSSLGVMERKKGDRVVRRQFIIALISKPRQTALLRTARNVLVWVVWRVFSLGSAWMDVKVDESGSLLTEFSPVCMS